MKILIVDDEKISRTILLKKMEVIGECTAVDDGLRALELFDKAVKNKEAFDLITLDVSMPGMDGSQVLKMIRKKEKIMKVPKKDRVRIIMVTSRMNLSTIKKCIHLGCDGYLSKPVNKYQLMENLGRIGLEQPKAIKKDDKTTHIQIVARIIKRFYNGKIQLPVLPRIVKEVQKLMESQDPSLEELSTIVKTDILISTKLISIANSALYRGVDKIDNLTSALLRLGMKASYGSISTLVTKDLFQSNNKVLDSMLEKLWMHSFACACLAKRFAEDLGTGSAETVFLMGIVHDIGKMLLIKAIADIDPKTDFENKDLQVAIHEIHTTFGAAVLKKMRFAEEFIRIAEFHHWNNFSREDDRELLLIHLSDYLAKKIGFGFLNIDETDEDLKDLASLKQLKIDPDNAMETAEEIKAVIQDAARAF